MISKKRKILFVIPTLDAGGAERVVSHLANNIDREKFIPQILLVNKAEHTYLKNIKNDVEVIKMDLEIRIKYSVFKILRYINKISPDIVFTGMGDVNVLTSIFIPFYKKYKWIARETNTVGINVTNKRARFFI